MLATVSASTALAITPQDATKTVADSAGAVSAKARKGAKADETALQLAPLAHPTAFYQTNAQRAVADARQAVLRQVKRLEEQTGCTPRRAMLTFLTQAAAGRLDGDTAAAMLELSRDSRGRKASAAHVNAAGLPTLRTLQNWMARAQEALPGDNLAPRLPQADMEMVPWMVLAVELKRRPQKPATSEVLLQMKQAWPEFSLRWVQKERTARLGKLATPEQLQKQAALLAFPSYDQVIRFFGKFSKLDLLEGQHLGSAARAHKLYHRRTNAGLNPFDEVHADGWNTHFTAPDGVTGNYVSYEVWHFHDVATGYTTPFSIGLSESAEVILKGLENCIRVGGVPRFWQTDSTGSVKNQSVEFDPILSLSARAGLTVVHPVAVGNSQANGIAENYNKYLDKKSKALATYMHPSMDSLAFKQVRKYTAQMVKAAQKGDTAARTAARAAALRVGKGILFESMEEMVAWLEEVRVLGNNTPYSKNPKIICPQTGKLRHQTPQEAIDMARAQGWEPVALDDASLVELFYAHVRRKVFRESVIPYNKQRYHHECLGDYNGETVVVAVDRMDGTRVWVKDLEGRLICEAKFMPDCGYRSQSINDIAEERRMAAQIKRKENQIEAIKDRRDPERRPLDVQAIEMQAGQVLTFGAPGLTQAASPARAETPDEARMRWYAEEAEREERERLENEQDGPDRLFLMMRAEQDELERQEQEESDRRKAM